MITQAEALDLTHYLHKPAKQLAARYRRVVSGAARAEDHEDLIQEALARLVESLRDRLPKAELRAYAKVTLHNLAVDKIKRGAMTRRRVARYAETVYGLSAQSCEREIELIEILDTRLTRAEKRVAALLIDGAGTSDLASFGYSKNDRAALRSKLAKIDRGLVKRA